MVKIYNVGIIGCGDFLRRQADTINASLRIKIKSLFDLEEEKARHFALVFRAEAVASSEAIFADKEIEVLFIFTPPWVRRDLVLHAACEGKHIIMPKPVAVRLEDATEIVEAVRNKIHCAVFYRRTGHPFYETLKRIFDSNEIGKLSLYKEDWLHHYPTWNTWATDPEKNKGPFMDAMIHTLNIGRYLMDGEVTSCCFFSHNYSQKLRCNDTEFLKVDFSNGGAAYLFITWAANLEVYDPKKNEREFIWTYHLITDQGWYVKEDQSNGQPLVKAVKNGRAKTWPFLTLPTTPYDGFIEALEQDKAQEFDIFDAWKDLKILTEAYKRKNPGNLIN